MWDVYETKEVTKSLDKIPRDILVKYKAWVEVVRAGGFDNLKNFSGFKDHKLKGKLRNCRASRLNIQYRVIYTAKTKIKEIVVLKVTPHKYEE